MARKDKQDDTSRDWKDVILQHHYPDVDHETLESLVYFNKAGEPRFMAEDLGGTPAELPDGSPQEEGSEDASAEVGVAEASAPSDPENEDGATEQKPAHSERTAEVTPQARSVARKMGVAPKAKNENALRDAAENSDIPDDEFDKLLAAAAGVGR